MHFLSVRPPSEPAGDRFPTADGQHCLAIQPSAWSVPPALPPYPSASEGTDLRGIDSLDCWS